MTKTTTTKKVPDLRFPEFEGEWEKKKIKDFTTINPKSESLPHSFIYIDLDSVKNGILFKNKRISKNDSPSRAQRLLKKNDILFQTVRPYQKNNLLFKLDKEDYVASTGYAQIRTSFSSGYLYYFLHTENLLKIVLSRCTGTSYPAINSKDLGEIKINLPSLPEQQKIADFLTQVDKKIELLEKKQAALEQYKKGVMQKIFNREIRFQIENEAGERIQPPAWEEKKLGDFITRKSIRNKNLKVSKVLSVNNLKGFISQSEQFDNHRVASKDLSNYKIVDRHDVAFNPSRINVGSIAILKDFERGIVSPMYEVFSLNKNINQIFFENLIETHFFNHLVKVGCSGSVRDSLNYEVLEEFKLNFPCIEEQTKIANFLSALDQKIEAVAERSRSHREWKKGLLQKMFV